MPQNDPWDWPLLLYVGTVILQRSEAEFWRLTPRKFKALFDAHIEVNDSKEGKEQKGEATGFIDQII